MYKKVGPETEHNACLPALRVWEGFEWLKPIEKGCLYSKQVMACLQKKTMNNHKNDLPLSCVWLTMLALSRSEHAVRFIDKQQWGECSLEAMYKLLKHFSAASGLDLALWKMESQNGRMMCVETKRFNHGTDRAHALLVPVGDHFHMLPLAKPDPTVAVVDPMPPIAASSSSNLATAHGAVVPVDVIPTTAALVPEEPEEVEEDDFVVIPPGILPYMERPTFIGIHTPPPDLRWVGGWWPSTCPREFCITDLFPQFRPDVASATMAMAKKYLNHVYYLPVDVSKPLELGRNGVVTDGKMVAIPFTEGEVVRAGNSQYRAVPVMQNGVSLLSLMLVETTVIDSVIKTLRSAIPFVDDAGSVELECRKVPVLKSKNVQCAKWIMEVHTEKDPLKIAVKQKLRQEAAALQYGPGSEDVEDVAQWVNHIRGQYPGVEGVSGRYGWGYCYSCGMELPGTFKQRMCKKCGQGVNTGLADLVAQGQKIVSAAKPIAYPGVVNTKSRHPALKAEDTFATERNFRLSPGVLGEHLHPHPLSAKVRDSVEWVSTGRYHS